ncbi:hypothetical protein VIGAN_01439400, partial [Vigna angularis var. angularis]
KTQTGKMSRRQLVLASKKGKRKSRTWDENLRQRLIQEKKSFFVCIITIFRGCFREHCSQCKQKHTKWRRHLLSTPPYFLSTPVSLKYPFYLLQFISLVIFVLLYRCSIGYGTIVSMHT